MKNPLNKLAAAAALLLLSSAYAEDPVEDNAPRPAGIPSTYVRVPGRPVGIAVDGAVIYSSAGATDRMDSAQHAKEWRTPPRYSPPLPKGEVQIQSSAADVGGATMGKSYPEPEQFFAPREEEIAPAPPPPYEPPRRVASQADVDNFGKDLRRVLGQERESDGGMQTALLMPGGGGVSIQPPANDTVSAFIAPEKKTDVTISRRDVNRIHCTTDVSDVFYSKEKPVSVTVAGADVWVKVLKKVVGGTEESYDKDPVDLHVVCGESVYTLIMLPTDIDSVTLRLGNPIKDKAAENAKEWGALPIEEKVQRLTLMVYRDEVPQSFNKTAMTADRRTPRMFRNMVVQGVNRVSAPGLGMAVLEYEIVANPVPVGGQPLQLRERDFLNVGLSKTIVGVTVDPLVLDNQHRRARLIIVERSLSDGR